MHILVRLGQMNTESSQVKCTVTADIYVYGFDSYINVQW